MWCSGCNKRDLTSCSTCKGSGKWSNALGEPRKCNKCAGTGLVCRNCGHSLSIKPG